MKKKKLLFVRFGNDLEMRFEFENQIWNSMREIRE